jgi:hypothetical protein
MNWAETALIPAADAPVAAFVFGFRLPSSDLSFFVGAAGEEVAAMVSMQSLPCDYGPIIMAQVSKEMEKESDIDEFIASLEGERDRVVEGGIACAARRPAMYASMATDGWLALLHLTSGQLRVLAGHPP